MSMDTKQLLDSLADHMALYHRASSQSGDTRRSQYRINVMRWMSSLTPQQRQAALTTVDEHWLAILLQMRDHVLRQGHGFFILLPDMPDRFQIPSSSRSLQIPSLCYRKARGLLARDGEDAEAALTGSVLLFSSSDGNNDATELRPLDTLTVSEEFVSDVNRFVKVMDSVSNSEFLMSSSNASSSSWDELPWLTAKGFYSLGSFVANRIELSLGLSWMHSRLKKRSGPPRSGTGNARDVAFSAFWRKKGVIDWWCQLDPATRSRAFQLALSKASKLEVQRLFQDGNQKSFMMNPEKEVTMSVRSPKQCTLQSITGVSSNNAKNKHFSLLKNGFRDTSSTDQIANGLSVLEEITSTMSLRSVVVPENSVLFLSTLCSAHTVIDNTMRRIRDLFSKVSSESLEFDLLKEEKIICQVIKPTVVQRKEKSRKARRAKKKFACSKNMTEDGSLPKENNKVGPAYQRLDKHLQNGEISQIPTHEGGSNSSNDMLKSQSRVEVANANKVQTQKRRSKAKKKRNNNLDGKPSMSNIENKLDTCKLETEDNDSLICPEQKLACSSMEVVKNKNSNSPEIPGSCFGNTKDICVGNTDNVSVQEQLVKNDKCCSLVKCNSFSLENSVSKNHGSSKERCSGEKSCLGYKDGQASEKSSIPCEQSKSDNNLESCCNETSFSCIERDDKLKRGSSHTQFRYDRQKLFLPTSYEWPGSLAFRLPSTSNQMLPTTSDRLHLEVGWNWHHSQPPIVALKQPWQRNSLCHGGYKGRNICPQPSKNNDWAQVLNEGCSASSSVLYPIEGGKNPIIQVACVSNAKDSIGNIKPKDFPGHETIEESYCDDAAYSSCNGDEMEGYSVSDDETEKYPAKNALHFSDYSKYFGGGVMYWNTADYAGTGYSRPPSLSSEDSSWARHEDDLKVAIEDIVSVPPIPSPYSNSGLSSPGTAFFSPFEQFNPVNPSTHAGFAKSGNDLTANLISPGALEEQDSMSSIKGSNKVADGIKNDMLSYPILRPIVIPSMSRRASRKDLSNIKESRSSCTSSRRREGSSLKRPPSPVVLCVPSPPPPSPVRGFRKQRCFPPVRSGSSSPRHWGINSWFSEAETEVDEKCLPIGHAKVAGFSLGAKYITGTPPMHNVGNIHTDCLVTISNIPLEDEHPDITLPLQSPEIENNPSIQTALAKLHNILHEEIECFCKKIASENQRRKPFVNAAVDKVTRALQVLWPRSRTKIFGSIATGLALPSSDVDVVVCLPPVRNLEPIKEAGILEGRNGIKETCLQHAARYLADQDWVKTDSLKTIENTAIPIIMLVVKLPSQHSYKGFTVGEVEERRNELLRGCEQRHISGIGISAYSLGDIRACEGSCASWSDNEQLESVRLDISFESASHTGLRTASLVRDLTGKFPAIIPLALVFKQFLTDRCLDHPYSGGLSSYCLVLLITRFLQHQHHAGRSINQNLGRLFLDFLYFFGCVFDPRQMRISIYGSGMYVNRGRAQSIDPLHIDDPLDDPIYPVNNVGRNCFRIHQCIKAFADAHSILKRELLSLDFLNISDSNHCRVLQKVIPSFGDLNKRKT